MNYAPPERVPVHVDDGVPDGAIDRVVAVGFLTEHDLTVLGQGFRRAYRLPGDHEFEDLLAAIDRADVRARSGPA